MLLAGCFCQQTATMSGYKFTPRAVASPDAPQQPLVRKRARSGGATWVRVSRQKTPSTAKEPRTGGSQQPACDHEEHQSLSASEAAAFAAQFWDKKTHPTKASQHEFLATCIDVDLEHNVKHAGRQKYTTKRGHAGMPCMPALQQPGGQNSERPKSLASVLKNMVSYPPHNPYISETAFSHRFQKVYTNPPYTMKFWCFGQKIEKTLKKHEFAPRWHVMNVPERYTFSCFGLQLAMNALARG